MSNPSKVPSHVLTREVSEGLIQPYLDEFDTSFRTAWDEWKSLPVELGSSLSSRTRAAFINDRAVHHIKQSFAERSGARCVERRGFLTVLIAEKIEIRLKKLDRNKKTRNIPTRFQKDYGRQLPLFGAEDDATRLNAGYQLDHLQTTITGTFVTCQLENDLLYWIASDKGDSQNIHRFDPSPPELPIPTVRATNVRKANDQ